ASSGFPMIMPLNATLIKNSPQMTAIDSFYTIRKHFLVELSRIFERHKSSSRGARKWGLKTGYMLFGCAAGSQFLEVEFLSEENGILRQTLANEATYPPYPKFQSLKYDQLVRKKSVLARSLGSNVAGREG
ncbi:hypothetical protein BS47DRAFT_1353077, partial [Hydnum rufescens UP504]